MAQQSAKAMPQQEKPPRPADGAAQSDSVFRTSDQLFGAASAGAAGAAGSMAFFFAICFDLCLA